MNSRSIHRPALATALVLAFVAGCSRYPLPWGADDEATRRAMETDTEYRFAFRGNPPAEGQLVEVGTLVVMTARSYACPWPGVTAEMRIDGKAIRVDVEGLHTIYYVWCPPDGEVRSAFEEKLMKEDAPTSDGRWKSIPDGIYDLVFAKGDTVDRFVAEFVFPVVRVRPKRGEEVEFIRPTAEVYDLRSTEEPW